MSTGEVSLSGCNDVLELALGKEHGGRVRGVAGFVNPSTYFHLPRRKRQSLEETIKINMEKLLAEQTAKIIEETRKRTIEEQNAFWVQKFEAYKAQFTLGNGNEGQAGSYPPALEKHIPPVSGQASCSLTADLHDNDQGQAAGKDAEQQVEVNGCPVLNSATKKRRCEPKLAQPKEVLGQEVAVTYLMPVEQDENLKTSDADTQIKRRPKVSNIVG